MSYNSYNDEKHSLLNHLEKEPLVLDEDGSYSNHPASQVCERKVS